MTGAALRSGWLVAELPTMMAEDHFTTRFVGIFEELAGGVRARVDGFEDALDPGLAPPEFVRWVGSWLGLALDPSLPEERQRGLVAAAGALFPFRGTARGLRGLLEAFTEGTVDIQDGAGVFREGLAPPNRHHVVITVRGSGGMTEEHLAELVRQELPAVATFELKVQPGKPPSGRRRRGGPKAPGPPSPPPPPPPPGTAS